MPTALNSSSQMLIQEFLDTGVSRFGVLTPPTDTAPAVFTSIPVVSANDSLTAATALNDVGQVTLFSGTFPQINGYVWRADAGFTNLGNLGGGQTFPIALNNKGLAVGDATNALGQSLAFAWTAADGIKDLNTLIPAASAAGVTLFSVLDVNDTGDILVQSNVGLVVLRPGTISSAPPVAGPIVGVDPLSVGTLFAASVTFTDQDTSDTHSAVFDWGDGQQTTGVAAVEVNGQGSLSAKHAYAGAGIYLVTVTVTDNTGKSAQVSRNVVVYDPNAGSVSGSGAINSPAGAYKPNPALMGRAQFGFEAKYQKGATVPVGRSEFQFQAASLQYQSQNFDFLVVAGARAQFKGIGKLNGQDGYRFMLTAVDGQISGGGGVDRYRIRIWHTDKDGNDVVDYDNQVSPTGEGTNTEGTVISEGKIEIRPGPR
jgi:PKD repeat protein